jgi:hypothetical protein
VVKIETIEGIIDNVLWYHYDVGDDVLYLRFTKARETEALGEETDEGFILLRNRRTGRPIGLTVVNWWKRFGRGGRIPDSIRELHKQVEPWAAKLAA